MSDKAFEEYWKDYEKCWRDIPTAYKFYKHCWHASGEYHIKRVIEILEKYRCTDPPHSDNIFPAEDAINDIKRELDHE